MDDLERKFMFKEKMESHFDDYCKEHYDIQCIYIGSKDCNTCKGLSYDHNIGCKQFLDGWVNAVKALTLFK
jgi:hypothetical protein